MLRIITRCLAQRPEQRYQTIDDLFLDLKEFIAYSRQQIARQPMKLTIVS
jgi:hypothetical protein